MPLSFCLENSFVPCHGFKCLNQYKRLNLTWVFILLASRSAYQGEGILRLISNRLFSKYFKVSSTTSCYSIFGRIVIQYCCMYPESCVAKVSTLYIPPERLNAIYPTHYSQSTMLSWYNKFRF